MNVHVGGEDTARSGEGQAPLKGVWGKPLKVNTNPVDKVQLDKVDGVTQEGPPKKNMLSVISWNVQDLGAKQHGKGSEHHAFVTESLQKFVAKENADIVVLQEVTDCDMVDGAIQGWRCVGSVIPERVESNLPQVVLGNVLLYNEALFQGSYDNRVLTTGFKHAARQGDVNGDTLFDHHGEKCDWEAYNGCRNAYSDMPSATSVKLTMHAQRWTPSMLRAFPGGVRVMDVHLFAGARKQNLAEAGKAHRRRFQLRSLMALVDDWNKADTNHPPPTTIYAGDFNTRKKSELKGVVAPAGDYGVRLWCPADAGWCDAVDSKHNTHRAGTLDHVVVDIRPQPSSVPFRARSKVLHQGSGSEFSDHAPLFVEFQPTPGVDWPPTAPNKPQQRPTMDEDNFPTLG